MQGNLHARFLEGESLRGPTYLNPALIGGFGKININTIKRYFSLEKESKFKTPCARSNKLARWAAPSLRRESELRSKIGPYLAGLIESDGSIAVHSEDSKAKRYRPKILVVFNSADEPLAKKLAFITEAGTVYNKKNAGYIIWHIQKTEDVIKIINIINGYMRTPKIEALHRAINWFNKYDNCSIDCLGLDQSSIDSNAWLAGFTDGDGNFSVALANWKKKGKITSKRVQTFFRLEIRQTYHRDVSAELGGISYSAILNKIANEKFGARYFFKYISRIGAKKLSLDSKFSQIKSSSERRNYSTSSAGYVYSELGANSITFNSYLAGLIESSGSFAIHDVNYKSKPYSPKVLILFKLNDYFLVDKLICITGIGVLNKQKSSIIWQIEKKEDFLKLIHIINGLMRTPKIKLLHRAINWYNNNMNLNIKPLDIDLSPIDSNAWFAGFSQNKSLFTITTSKNSRVILKYKLLVNIVTSNTDIESELSNYFLLFCKISEYLKTSIITKIVHLPYVKCTFIIYAYTPESRNKVIEYFSKFPLLGKVSLDYEHWCKYNNTKKNTIPLTRINYKINNNNNKLLTSNLNNYLPLHKNKCDGSRRNFNTASGLSLSEKGLNPFFVSGFVDGEGCFLVNVRANNKHKNGWRVEVAFKINLHKKDKALFPKWLAGPADLRINYLPGCFALLRSRKKIQTFFGVGNIYEIGADAIQYSVYSATDLVRLIDHFDKYPLITQKQADYLLFKKVVGLINNNKHLTIQGLHQIISIKHSINKGISSELKAAFPEIVPT